MELDRDTSVAKLPQSHDTCETLLTELRAEEPNAWNSFVESYFCIIMAQCHFRWQLNTDDALEVCQEVFAVVFAKITRFKRQRRGSFRRWLKSIADNKCRAKLARAREQPLGGEDSLKLLHMIPDQGIGKMDCSRKTTNKAKIIKRAMRQVANEFSTRDTLIFQDAIVKQRSRIDIAKDFGVSANVIYLVVSRMKKRLSELLKRRS